MIDFAQMTQALVTMLCAWPSGVGVVIGVIVMAVAPFVPIALENTAHFSRGAALSFRPHYTVRLSRSANTGFHVYPRCSDSFLGHLGELRRCLVQIFKWVLVAFVLLPTFVGAFDLACGAWDWWDWRSIESWGELLWRVALTFFSGAGSIYSILAWPLLENLPESGALIAIGSVSPASVLMKTAFFVAVCAMMPFILSEAWKFVAPGLYEKEKGIAFPLIATSAALFYAGMAFAYFLVLQIVFQVVAKIAPDTVNWTPDIGEFFGFMLLMFFSFGLVFEIPVAIFILVRAGVVELEKLRQARPYVIVGAFVVAAIVTPPDILSQFLLAIPCWLLYEIGLLFASKWGAKKEEAQEEGGKKD